MAQQYKGTENNKTALVQSCSHKHAFGVLIVKIQAGSGNPQLTGEGKNADGAAQSVAGNLCTLPVWLSYAWC